ncbi:hypothetical protein B9Z55_021543 [Caenorhabditis nigoni]|uniref:Uncharacterized protein n=1 Tax=Caenorhabditis nigoni TaxID=1611254 RepID=A0A2G5TSK3_9PELO|nr:hypothetical protein B9Z55_021543 [Caenorhabditis nigoni]
MGLTKMSIDLALTKHRKDSGITSSPLFSAPFTACTAVLLLFHKQDTDALFYTSDHQFRVLDPTTIPSGTNVHVIVCPNMTRKVIRSA